jgi:hypothetical protein
MSHKNNDAFSTFIGKNNDCYIFQINLTTSWNYNNFKDSPLHVSTSEPNCPEFYRSESVYFHLNPTIQDWFNNYNSPYSIDYNLDSRQWILEIFDVDVAILYKITYG